MYPFGEEQDEEMDVDLVKRGSCQRIDNDDGFWFYDLKRYKQFVSIIMKHCGVFFFYLIEICVV